MGGIRHADAAQDRDETGVKVKKNIVL